MTCRLSGAIIWTNAGLLLIWTQKQTSIKFKSKLEFFWNIQRFTYEKAVCKLAVISYRTQCVNPLWPSDAIWRPGTGSTLAQVMACCLMAPSHYLSQCWLIIRKVRVIWWHYHKKIWRYQFVKQDWELHFLIVSKFPGVNELKATTFEHPRPRPNHVFSSLIPATTLNINQESESTQVASSITTDQTWMGRKLNFIDSWTGANNTVCRSTGN